MICFFNIFLGRNRIYLLSVAVVFGGVVCWWYLTGKMYITFINICKGQIFCFTVILFSPEN